ncbi:MAG TPA: cytochrome c biogenesis CcdA family protein [Actinomycetota bacterium]|nr:cytochrome c biogenesis CcdA family protein [Actinomycetota bacterium]
MMLASPSTAGVAGLAIAFAAGVISIATPCSLPLIPGYLAYMSGVSSGEGRQTKRVMGAAALFVFGFAVVFTALGATASVLGSFLLRQLPLFIRISGVFVILMGLASLGVLRLPFLYREKRFDLSKIRRGPGGAVPLGMAFAFGWTPCVGPVLGAILAVSANTTTAARGALLLFVYSLGMGIPFLIFALAYSRAGKTFGFVRRHARGIELTGGILLVGIGLLLVTDTWQQLLAPVVNLFVRHHWTL